MMTKRGIKSYSFLFHLTVYGAFANKTEVHFFVTDVLAFQTTWCPSANFPFVSSN